MIESWFQTLTSLTWIFIDFFCFAPLTDVSDFFLRKKPGYQQVSLRGEVVICVTFFLKKEAIGCPWLRSATCKKLVSQKLFFDEKWLHTSTEWLVILRTFPKKISKGLHPKISPRSSQFYVWPISLNQILVGFCISQPIFHWDFLEKLKPPWTTKYCK